MGALPDLDWIVVDFEGDSSGTGPLSWGQRHSWNIVTRTGEALCVGGPFKLAPDTTIDEVTRSVRFAMSRHEVLRTLLHRGPDGRMYQEVHRSGRVAIEVIDAGELDPDLVGGTVYEFYCNMNFDYSLEWPVKFGVVHRDGNLSHVVVAYAHVAVDGAGLHALVRDLATCDQVPMPPPVSGLTPREQAQRQQSPASQRQNENALRAWQAMLRKLPASMLVPSSDPREPRYWEARFISPAMYRAAALVAQREGASTSPVMVATFAVALAEMADVATAGFQVMVSNRFRPGFADSVSPTSQPSLCLIDVAGLRFDEVIRQADRASVRTHLCAYYDPYQLDDLVAELSRERGEELDLSCYFNDRRFETPRQAGEAFVADEVVSVLPESRLTWGVQMDRFNEKLFVHVNDVPGAMELFTCADTHFVSPAQLETLLRRMESILVEQACAPTRDHVTAGS